MAEAQGETTPSLAEQYLLKDKDEKLDVVQKPDDVKEPENTVTATASAAVEAVKEAAEATIAAVTPSAGESSDTTAPEEKAEDASAAAEESSESAATEAAEESAEATEESSAEEASEIKIETAPADFRFPTTNQTRHCFTRYVEYHRCIAAKGDGAPECDKFAKYYRSLCPGEWVDKWNEQRENGTFPGPL